MNTEKSPFAHNVKAGRERKGWSQREASGAASITLSSWGAYEEDRAEACYEILLRIIRVLDVPLQDVGHFLSDHRYFQRRNREQASQVLQAYSKLKPVPRRAVNLLMGIDEQS